MGTESSAIPALPGGAMTSRPLHFFWIVDCSGSMSGNKISAVNYAIKSTVKPMQDAAEDNPNAQLLVRTMKFSSGAEWLTQEPVPIEDFVWDNLAAGGITDLGMAFDLLAEALHIPPMPKRALPPVLVLLTDGYPTDDYKSALNRLMSEGWAKKAVRIAISIGEKADTTVLEEFTGKAELVLEAKNIEALIDQIKWASTVASTVSAPASSSSGGGARTTAEAVIEAGGIPQGEDYPETGDGGISDDGIWVLPVDEDIDWGDGEWEE